MTREYYQQHVACPKCHSTNIKQTLIGIIGEIKEDTVNRVECLECGFVGVVHDLVPENT